MKKELKRREFIKTGAVGLAGVSVSKESAKKTVNNFFVGKKVPMNVMVVLFDSFRPDHIGCYGNTEVKTPHIDAFAKQGTIFTRAYSEYPITIPTRTAMFTGNYTFTNRPWMKLQESDVTFVPALKEKGYYTGAISDTPMHNRTGFQRDFHIFRHFQGKCQPPVEESPVDMSPYYFVPGTGEADVRYYRNTLQSKVYYKKTFGRIWPELNTVEAERWVKYNKEKPFMLWLDYFDPHEPWDPPEPYASMYNPGYTGPLMPMPKGGKITDISEAELNHILAQYKGNITQVDVEFGKLMEMLDRFGVAENTLVILTSDHGEPFGDHGTMRKSGVPVYEELARIPLIMRKPGQIPENARIDALVQDVDIAPTILELAGTRFPKSINGSSLVPLLKGEQASIRKYAFNGAFQLRSSILDKRWKLIDNQGEKKNELYDLDSDPKEKKNLWDAEPERVEKMHYDLWKFRTMWSGLGSWHIEVAKRFG